MGMFDDIPIAQPRARGGMFDDIPVSAPPANAARATGVAAYDVGRSIEAGADRGVAGLLGFPADLAGLAIKGADYGEAFLSGRPYEDVKASRDAKALVKPEALDAFGGEAIYKNSRAQFEPQTTAGKFARTAAEFGTQAAIMPGRSLGSIAAYGLAPGVASEAAGQATEGTAAEPWARAGAALAAGGGAAYAARPNTAARAIQGASGALPQAERAEALTRFDGLMASAQETGIPLSPALAWDAATNGVSNLAEVQRHVEAMGRMRGFNAQMPGAVERAGRATFDAIAPVDDLPSALGQRVSEASRGALAASPVGQDLAAARQAAGPRITPDQAGQVIQPELRRVADAREAVRAVQAERDYGAARNAPENVGIERMITVERPGDPIVTPQAYSRPQFEPGAPAPLEGPSKGVAAPERSAPESLARFIARNGGIAADSDMLANDFHRFNVPGAGTVAREGGKPLDSFWRPKLMEAGYLPMDAGGGTARDIRAELFRKLRNEQVGVPTFPAGSEREMAAALAERNTTGRLADDYNHGLDLAKSRYHEDLTNVGIDPATVHPDIQSRVLGATMRDPNLHPLDAHESIVRAIRPNPEPLVKGTIVQEEIPDVRFGQVDPRPAMDAIGQQARTAKGDVRGALGSARSDLYGPGGDLDMSVEGLLHARERLDRQINAANEIGDGTKVRDLQRSRAALDGQLKQVPEVAAADANFAANSRPLEPFTGNTPLARVVQRDALSGRMATATEQVPSHLQGASATREALQNGTPAVSEALQGRLVTQILDGASDARGTISADRLRMAIRENEDVLNQFPEARDRLARVAAAQDGLDNLRGTIVGRLAQSDQTTAQAVSKMFPKGDELLANGEREVGAAMGALARQNLYVARQLLRAKVENAFLSATKLRQPGANEMGGAKAAAMLVGDPREAANIAAATMALPDGRTILHGMEQLFEVLRASGRRLNVGSKTSYNDEFLQASKTGGPIEGAARVAAGGFVKFPAKVQERLERWRLGKNVDELAKLFSDPDAIGAFRGLVAAGEKGGDIRGPVSRLAAIAARGAADGQTAAGAQ